MLASFIKINVRYATIIYLSGIKFLPEREPNIVYTTSVVNIYYFYTVFNKCINDQVYMTTFTSDEKVIIMRVKINSCPSKGFIIGQSLHRYRLMQLK